MTNISMPRIKLIVNPVSGRGAGSNSIPLIERYLHSLDASYDIIVTEKPWHAAELAQEAVRDGYDIVAGVGGDGTANEILNGLALAQQASLGKAAMGILAVGRGNDFSYGMHIPLGIEAGCQTLLHGRRVKIDIGWVSGGDYPGGRFFGNGVGIGFDAVVGFEALKMTRLSGFPSYIVAALKTISLYYQAPKVRIDYDGQSLTTNALMVSIMNGRRMGGGFMMAPDSSPVDGLLDLCIARQVSRGRILTLIPHFLRGTQSTQNEISTARASHIEVTALEGSLPAHADGETLCTRGEKLSIELHQAHLELICQLEAQAP